MKVIDLLNKIANEEEVPDGIKWGSHDFKWFVYEYKAKEELGEPTLLDYLAQCPQMLNDEIISFNKTEENKIPEKLKNYYDENIFLRSHLKLTETFFKFELEDLQQEIERLRNEIKKISEQHIYTLDKLIETQTRIEKTIEYIKENGYIDLNGYDLLKITGGDEE